MLSLEPRTTKAPQPLICSEFYDRVRPLQGQWISQTGFTPGMPIQIRVMLDYIVITTQNTRELWGYAEGLSNLNFNKMNQWIKDFPGVLYNNGDILVIRRDRYDCLIHSDGS
ncbi:SymE family type I addiction module toxin [Rahnella inusitata]|uniref:SymE family type I addiction module toxin n=1 Tax=Rahnella inusitata TaxID=58169 RepID=UPI0039BDA421